MGLTQRDLSGYTKVAIKMRAVKDKLPVRFALLNKVTNSLRVFERLIQR